MIDWKLNADSAPIDLRHVVAEHIRAYPGFSDWADMFSAAIQEDINECDFWTSAYYEHSAGDYVFRVTLPLGDPDEPPAFDIDVRNILLEEIEFRRPGGPHSGIAVPEKDAADIRSQIASLRKLADEMEARLGGAVNPFRKPQTPEDG